MQGSAPTTADEERRPAIILAIYSWDMLLALLAVLGALAAFGGQATVGARTVDVSLGEQVLAAVESATFAALLVIVATLLTRRQRWIRQAQIAVYAIAIVLGGVSLLLTAILPGQGVQRSALVALLVLVVDAAAIVALTGQRVVAWYAGSDGRVPRYLAGTVAFWAVTGAVLVLLQALR